MDTRALCNIPGSPAETELPHTSNEVKLIRQSQLSNAWQEACICDRNKANSAMHVRESCMQLQCAKQTQETQIWQECTATLCSYTQNIILLRIMRDQTGVIP